MDDTPLEIPCPTCRDTRHPVPRGAPYFPFCSRACRDRDLAAWTRGEYRFPGPIVADADAEDPDDTPAS